MFWARRHPTLILPVGKSDYFYPLAAFCVGCQLQHWYFYCILCRLKINFLVLINKLWWFATYQYCHIFLACNGKLHKANANTTNISMRITPRRARNTLLDEWDTWYNCVPWCLWWKLCVRHVVVITLSESTDTWNRRKIVEKTMKEGNGNKVLNLKFSKIRWSLVRVIFVLINLWLN